MKRVRQPWSRDLMHWAAACQQLKAQQAWSRSALAWFLGTMRVSSGLTEDHVRKWEKSFKKHQDAALEKIELPTPLLMEFQRCMGVQYENGIAYSAVVARALLSRFLEATAPPLFLTKTENKVARRLSVSLSCTRQLLRQFGFRCRTAMYPS